MDSFWNKDETSSADYYIRYKLENNTLCEVNRYNLGEEVTSVLGATYIDDTFYVVLTRMSQGVEVISFDLETHQETGRLQTHKWNSDLW